MYTKQQVSEISAYFQIEADRIKALVRIAQKYIKTKAKPTEKNMNKVVQKLIGEAKDTSEALFLGMIYYQLLADNQ